MATFDTLIKNARIIDGSGAPSFTGDVAISAGKIVAVGDLPDARAKKLIDAHGKALCPGFIDVHTHNDLMILRDRQCLSKLLQGVTSQIVGNCGFSAAPISDNTHELLKTYAEPSLGPWDSAAGWHTFSEYMESLDSAPMAVNTGALAGSGTIRIAVKGFDGSSMTSDEIKAVKAHIHEAFDNGALGFSLGLTYAPDNYYSTEEMVDICHDVAERGAVLSVHMRGEGDSLLGSVEEMVSIARKSGVSVHISHFKAAGRNNWGSITKAISLIDSARAEGLDITCDVYPYTACFSQFPYLMPPWAAEGGIAKTVERVKDPVTRQRIRSEMESRQESWDCMIYSTGWENVVISSVINPAHKRYEGMTVAGIAAEREQQQTECALDLFVENSGRLGFIFFFISEEDICDILRYSMSFVASDSTYISDGVCHPRIFGAFPRVLGRYVREKRVISLEEAVRKMTSFPAQRFGLRSKGLVRPGFDADLVIFDPDAVADGATYENPKAPPKGISRVMVAGETAVLEGQFTGVMKGTALRGNL